MASAIKVLFYVQHLWGVGHVYRATRIARGMLRAGMEVHLVWGGTTLPGFDFSGLHVHYLTPVRTSDVSFSTLLHGNGEAFSDKDKEGRKDHLLTLFKQVAPDILITEAFPFGRRQMRFELLPLLEAAKEMHRRPMVVSSIRDIMQTNRKPLRVEESNKLVEDYFDLVLVHGDPELVAISQTLQGIDMFRQKIRYTGLVVPDAIAQETSAKKHNVLVSVGGGAFGRELLHTALKAMHLSKRFPDNWLVTTGTKLPEEEFQNILSSAPFGMKVVRHLNDMVAELSACEVSVSHSGYNTVGDILRAGCTSVLHPYTDGGETEQLHRARLMQEKGLAICLEPDELSPEMLAAAVDDAAGMTPQRQAIDITGSSRSAEILLKELQNFR